MPARKRPSKKEAMTAINNRLRVYQKEPPRKTGVVGHSDGSTIDVLGKPDYVYVRVRGVDAVQWEVLNFHGALAYNMPVRIERVTPDGEREIWAIKEVDRSFFVDTGGWGGAGNVGAHRISHEWPDQFPGPDAINVYARALAPLRGFSVAGAGLRVYVNSAILTEYVGNGVYLYLGGSVLIESGDLPSTAGQVRIILISLNISDPDSPSLTKTLGDPVLALETAEPTEPDFPADEIPVCAVLVRDDHTQLEEIDIYDRRKIVTGNVKLSALTSPDGTLDVVEADNDGNVVVTGTVDGVDISAHAANPDAHHDRSHAMTGAPDHTAGNWKLFHSNGSGAVAELALGGAGTFLRSNGAAAVPTFELAAGAIPHFLALPGLRGLWPMSAYDGIGDAIDQSGNGRTLTYNGNPTYNFDGLAPYIEFDGTGDYLSRPDEAGLDILGTESYVANPGVTFGGWFWLNSTTNTFTGLISKWDSATNNRGYLLALDSSDAPLLSISDTGLAGSGVGVTGGALSLNSWYFIAGRFTPSTEVALFQNGTKTTNTTSIHASIFNNGAAALIGAYNNGAAALQLPGRASLCFLCASALSDDIIDNLYQSSRALFGV